MLLEDKVKNRFKIINLFNLQGLNKDEKFPAKQETSKTFHLFFFNSGKIMLYKSSSHLNTCFPSFNQLLCIP